MLKRTSITLLLAALLWSGMAVASERQPVLVELFTSEGCSDCPPADALLRHLDVTQPIGDAQIIALEEHVDYWNDLGWRDPWSAARFTRRQQRYAAALRSTAVYTPEMVVDGQTGFVGSNAARAREVIAAAAREPQATITLARVDAGNPAGDSVKLSIDITAVPASFRGQSAELWLALTEDGLTSHITRGENAGRVLRHDAVVRRLKPIKALTLGDRPLVISASLPLEPGWQRGDLHAVAFVQMQANRHIVGMASLPLIENGIQRPPGH